MEEAELSHGRIPMNQAEEMAVDELVAGHTIIGLTRAAPMNTGPILLTRDDDHVFLVYDDGAVDELDEGATP